MPIRSVTIVWKFSELIFKYSDCLLFSNASIRFLIIFFSKPKGFFTLHLYELISAQKDSDPAKKAASC